MTNNCPRTRVLVAGCSYAGIATVVNLLDLCLGKPARGAPHKVPHELAVKGVPVDIHIVDERDGYLKVHLIGCPLAFASNDAAPKMWVRFEDVPALQHRNVRWTQGSVIKLDADRRVAHVKHSASGELVEYAYDYFVAATGLRRQYPIVPQTLTRKCYLAETGDHIETVKGASEGVVVIGGGAVGIEMAAELKLTQPKVKVTLVQSRDKLLSAEALPDEFKAAALGALQEMDVEVVLGRGRVMETSTVEEDDGSSVQILTLGDGTVLTASHVINAVSTQIPVTSYLPPSVLDNGGLVKINENLRFLDQGKSRRHYAIGDIVAWSGIKRCGAAMHMGFLAAQNLHQQMLSEREGIAPDFVTYPEVPPMIALAIGRKAATYAPAEGVHCGAEQMRIFFGDDLGFTGCWNHLKLSEPADGTGVSTYVALPQTAPYREMQQQSAVTA
ncbi:related to pyridine nucleotide-disulphide oxidoreductase AMID-like [Lecanosticta acicola]|uniref:Related to pyridine nucleotide-disulphide oxidoreductase AMID-like n=1 Tax=Lecanosticta acicola TaxID=111012 RepID=A0AAI8YVK5_9PEZI|nr:related to pyridine nucleotide-disulphide oxidoreductase AMID-like [Lecanosticta acicola]